MNKLNKTYNPIESEEKIYQLWESTGAFAPESSNNQETPLRQGFAGQASSKQIPNSNNQKNKTDSDSSLGDCILELGDSTTKRSRFVVVMPPPNVTGSLHIGHALGTTLQDIMTRYHRLKGDETLYLPGTDHAGIATQSVVEKKLAKEGVRRHELGREKFVRETHKWKDQSHERIVSQTKSIGASCDWSREAFTLSDSYSEAVNTAFKHLYDKGLIYRGTYIVNWCPKCGTAISDDEVEHVPQKATLYYFKYDNDFPITIATTRPETKLGDTAVAVNPDDERYKQYVGKSYQVDINGIKRTIKIIADRSVDKEFGAGAVGVTPAHSIADWLLKDKHDLEVVEVIDSHGRMMPETVGAKYGGLKTLEAREKLAEYFKARNLMQKEAEVDNNLSVCYRCGGAIEPRPSLQWFVKMKPLAKKAMEAVKSGKIKIIPKRFEKIYFHWLENIRDWCISRQLWWGHQLPVWTREVSSNNQETPLRQGFAGQASSKQITNLKSQTSNDIFVGDKAPDEEGWIQDEDVLDTWFSSSLWPFATLGWPRVASSKKQDTRNKLSESDFDRYYPTDVLETGYDIIFFWVSRMIMMGLELTGKAPFDTVYLHGLVRDEHGRKMSKSLGNVVEPVELSKQWGTDALRMALVIGTSAGNDVNFSESRAKGYRNFANKIWNASRFVLTNMHSNALESVANQHSNNIKLTEQDKKELVELDKTIAKVARESDMQMSSRPERRPARPSGGDPFPSVISNESERSHEISPTYLEMTPDSLTEQDRKDLAELDTVISKVTHLIDTYKFSLAGEALYEYFWHTFADVIIERSKDRLESGGEDAEAARFVLWRILHDSLVMLHPFMPFVTETIWQEIPLAFRQDKMLITAKWPRAAQ